MKNKIFVALDTDKINEALNIVNDIKDYIAGIKLGLEFFTKNGPKGIEAFSSLNIPIFLDLKFLDIKNTVIKSIKTLEGLPVEYLSIHLLNGKDTLLEAKKTSAIAHSLPPNGLCLQEVKYKNTPYWDN